MSCRGVCGALLNLVFLGLAAPIAAEEPLKPINSWIVNYDATECTAQRSYGDSANPTILAIAPSAWGNTFELMLATKTKGPDYTEEKAGSVDFGGGPIKAWLLHYGIKASSPLDVFKFRIPNGEMVQAASSNAVTFQVHGRSDVSVTLQSVPALLRTLQDCTTNLQHYWNMIDPEQKKIVAPAIGDLRPLFTSGDYPDEAFTRGQEGTVQFLLLVDEKGTVAACHVLQPSGIPVLDGMGCQVIRKRARFKPAVDASGKPLRSSVVTPPISWRLEGP